MLTTPDRQSQQEYIITADELTNLILDLEYRRYNLARITQDQIRSRPAPAPECVNCKCSDCIPMKHIVELSEIKCKEAAKAEREQVLHKIDDTIMKKETWSRLELLAIIAEQITQQQGGVSE